MTVHLSRTCLTEFDRKQYADVAICGGEGDVSSNTWIADCAKCYRVYDREAEHARSAERDVSAARAGIRASELTSLRRVARLAGFTP